MNKRKIYCIGGDDNYANWIIPLGFEIIDKLDNADLCLATGGEDWDSSWYGCKNPHETISSNIRRDIYEMEIFKKAIQLKIPICGICRNSQILPVLVDNKRGKIVQHQSNPGYIHKMKTYDGLELDISSTHHECSWPYNLIEGKEFKLLGWSENLLKYRYLDADTQNLEMPETEVVVYPTIFSIGYQMHPEMLWNNKEYDKTIKWCQDTLIKFLNKQF